MTPLLASILLSLVSAVAYAGAAIVQEQIAATTAPSRWTLLRRGGWWGAVLLNGTGALLHVVALGLGPLTVVQPLGVLTIVFAAPMAALLRKRPVGGAGRRGILLVSAGLAGILLLTGTARSESLTDSALFSVAGVAVALIAALIGIATAAREAGRPGIRSISLATAAGVAYGTASVCVKAVAEGWALTSMAAALPVVALIAFFATTGLATSQASYRGGGLAAPLATTTVVNPVIAAVVGIALLGEGFRHGAPGAVTALAAALAAIWGLAVLTADHTGTGPATATPRTRGRKTARTPSVVIPAPGPAARGRGRVAAGKASAPVAPAPVAPVPLSPGPVAATPIAATAAAVPVVRESRAKPVPERSPERIPEPLSRRIPVPTSRC